MRTVFVIAAIAILHLGVSGAARAQSEFAADLRGANEVPPVATDAFGSATFDINYSESILGVNFELTAVNLKRAFMGHIHCAPPGMNGPIVVWLAGRAAAPANTGFNIDGAWVGNAKFTEANVILGTECKDEAGNVIVINNLIDLLQLMVRGLTYANIHTVPNGGGEIRGQIKQVAPLTVP